MAGERQPSASEQRELQEFLENEKRKAVFNELIAKLTGECWDKCMGSYPGNKLSGYEQQCFVNCAQRFMDTSQFILKKFQR